MKRVRVFLIYFAVAAICMAAYSGCTGQIVGNGNPPDSSAAAASTGLSASPGVSETSAPAGPRMTIEEKMSLASMAPDPEPVVGAARGTDYNTVVSESIKNAGGLNGIIHEKDTVLIKPNLGAPLSKSGSPDNTDYRVVQAIADAAAACGAERIIVAEGSYSGNVFEYNEYDKITGVELVDLNACTKDDCYMLKPEHGLTGEAFYIPKVYMDADVVISAAKLKTYLEVGATLSLKNVFGVPPSNLYGSLGGKVKLHSLGVDKSIVDLNLIRKPDFAVIDGIIGGEGIGPQGNKPVASQIIIAGSDLVATDTVALTFMGFDISEVPHVRKAADAGLGIYDIKKIKVEGVDLEKDKMKFSRK